MKQSNSTTTRRLVFKGHCNGASLSGAFAILLSVHGNVSIAEVK